ncbi:Btz domain [Cinara cedri]|uniref:Protein CASC3 n=1 Tax=Cinara cedri TaxID=506608 RepID=A0A5E4M6D4_9HEMI|nr:Btz domain [Cinara cedri]
MEIAADVKEEDNITTKTVLPIEDINDQTLVSPTTELNVSTAANDIPALDCTDSNDYEPETKLMSVVDVNRSSKSVSIEANKPVSVLIEDSNSVSIESSNSVITEHNLNVAMASTTISDTVEVKQNSNEDILDEQLKQNTITTENENSVVEKESTNSMHENNENILETDELNSTVGGEYEDARDYIDDEYYVDEKLTDNENERSFISANVNDESYEEEEQGDNEDEQATFSSEIPLPVDDDTNDPQYIPRRGRFYEHDDRMAYSTTSSEDCESSDVYDDTSDDEDDDNSLDRRNRKVYIDNKNPQPIDATEDIAVQNIEPQGTSIINTLKVLNISKFASERKHSFDTPITTHNDVSSRKLGGRKFRNIDSLDKWGHDMYDEREQTRKSRDELLSSYGYDIREEIEAPRARRHHKYGRTATVKYNRNWQDTKAYTGTSSEKRGGPGRRNVGSQYNKNKPKSTPAEEYDSEFPILDHAKTSTEIPQKVIAQDRSQGNKNIAVAAGSSKNSTHITRTSTKYSNSPQNRSNQREPQNSGFLPQSSSNKNFFNRNNYNSKERDGTPVARDSPSTADNSNYFNRNLPQQSGRHSQPHSFKQHYNNTHVGHGHNQSQSSSIRGRNFQQHNNSPQFNRDRYFSKDITTQSPNLHHNTVVIGSGRIQHSEEHYHHFNNQQYENEVQKVESQTAPVVRSAKRYSVQSRRELPDPVLNFGSMSKVTQQQSSISHHQQNNSLIMQESQTTQLQQLPPQMQQPPPQMQQPPPQMQQPPPQMQQPPPQMQQPPPQMQQPPPQMQQPPPQMQQPPPQIQQIQLQQPPMQLQQFHQPMTQMNSHHSMVVDPNTGMVLMATDPSMYHHQIYAAPQYGTTVAQGSPGNSAEDQNAAAVAAAALQMLAAQAAVYQPLPTGPTSVTSPPTGTQQIQQQPPDSFMTTYYQPQAPKQPPPRRVNLAIPIVAPSEHNQQQHASKSNPTQTPPPTATSTN